MPNTKSIDVTGYLSEDRTSISLEHAVALRHVFRAWEGRRLLLSVEPFARRRSNQQNRYMWGVVVVCVRAWHLERDGHAPSKDGVYAMLRRLCGHELKIEVINGVEAISMTGKRFSQMTTVEFENAVTFIRKYYAELGCDIPEPREDNLLSDYVLDRIEKAKKRHGEDED